MRTFFNNEKERLLDFSPNLYLGIGIDQSSLEKLKKRLRKKPFVTNVYLIVLSENDSDQLDIISSKLIAQPVYGEHRLHVAGLARNMGEAYDLITKIAEDCLKERDDCALKEFLQWQ